jgi:hypothetical protein
MIQTQTNIPSFKNITKTYCGATGCACGCGGTYSAPEHADVNHYTPKSDRTVKARLNKVLKALADNPNAVEFDAWGDEGIWSYEYGTENQYGERRVIRIYATLD